MTDFNVRVIGTANVSQMQKQFAQMEKQVAALNAQFAKMINLQSGVDSRGFSRMAHAASMSSRVYRDALSSTGMFEVQQLRVNRATDEYIDKLKAQKLSFRQLAKERKVAMAAYKEQLALENMVVNRRASSNRHGKDHLDVSYPRAISREMDTAGKRVAWFNEQLKSGAHQMVNWGKNTQWAGRQLMVGFTIPIAAAGAAAAVMSYQVDKELTRVAKVYDTTADANDKSIRGQMALEREFQQLRKDGMDTAMQAARDYGAAGKDTLEVQAALAATGQKGMALQKATNEVMRISVLGELDKQDAINATIALQSTWGMNTKQLTDTFNYMNAVENATSLETKDFAAAIPIASGAVKMFGGDIQELGTLLTIMRSRGIAATEGANTLKAAMQRLGRPSKQVQQEWTALTHTDIKKIFEDGATLVDIFKSIGQATEDLSNKDKIKAFAALFGTYQVQRMSQLVDGVKDLDDATTQAGMAAKIAGQDTSQWAQTADREMQRAAKSVSGRWDRAINSFKLQLVDLGAPFLNVATMVVNGVSNIITWFQKLPSIVKHGIGIMLGLTAIAGPLVMLAGLFGNLFGNALKGVAILIGLAAKMNIVSKEGRAMQLATKLAEEGFISESKALQQLNANMEAHIAALRETNILTSQIAKNTGTMPLSFYGPARPTNKQWEEAYYASTPRAQPGIKGFVTNDKKMEIARNRMGEDFTAAAGLAVRDAKATEEATRKVSKNISAAAASATALSIGMATTMISSNRTADAIGNFLITSSLLLTALGALKTPAKAVATYMKESVVAAKAFAIQSVTAGMGWKGVGLGLKSMGKNILGFIGPFNLAVMAATAVGIGIFAWKKHIEAARKAQAKLHNEVNSMADDWAKAAGKVEKTYKDIATAQSQAINAGDEKKLYEAYTTGPLKKDTQAFNSDEFSASDRETFAAEHFLDLMVKYGLSAQEAAAHIKAMYAAANFGANTQNAIVAKLLAQYGELYTDADKTKALFENQIKVFRQKAPGTDEAKKAGQDVADSFKVAFAQTKPGSAAANELLKEFNAVASAGFDREFDQMMSYGPRFTAPFKKLGIESGEAFRIAVRDAGGINNFIEDLRAAGVIDPDTIAKVKDVYNTARESERQLVGQVTSGGDAIGQALGKNIDSVTELGNAWIVMVHKMTYAEAVKKAQELRTTFDMVSKVMGSMGQDADHLEQKYTDMINEINAQHGFKTGKGIIEAISNLLNKTKEDTDANTAAANRWANAMAGVRSKVPDMAKEAMGAIQQDIADDISTAFDNNMNASLDAQQAQWDKKAETLSAAFEKQNDALDAKWERRKDNAQKYWDARVASIEKAITAEQKAEEMRKKMFDAEVARINKLNEMANRNIDFNVAVSEGRLDDAAKIRNDASAEDAQSALQAAADAGSARSEARVSRLNKRRDSIEQARDKFMKDLDKREDAEKKHLKKVQNMQEKSLKSRTDAAMAASKKEWDNRKKSLDKQLDLFLAFTGRNEKELRKHMADVGISYNKFERDVIRPKSTTWGKYFGDKLKFQMRKAGMSLASDNVWSNLSDSAVDSILHSMGLGNMSDFKHFVKTGEVRNTGGRKRPRGTGRNNSANPVGPTGGGRPIETRHEGGVIGSGMGSRAGVARNVKGLHSSEVMVRAQKGETLVNRRASAENADLLAQINSGKLGDTRGPRGAVGGGPGAFAAIAGAAAFNAMRMAASAGFDKSTKRATRGVGVGSYAPGKGGAYGGRAFDAEQLKYAAIIASVGSSMGMSGRDIEIAIMTAITESGLRNIDYGDRDSLGLFQQRPSMGWGSRDQILNPRYAARAFFGPLKAHRERNDEAPWLAAQHIQRSAFADGSNYRAWWPAAQAIFKSGITHAKSGGYTPSAYVGGSGGWHRASTPGKGWSNSHDYRNGLGSPLFAAADGRVIESRAITSGGSPGNGAYSTPYRSYGETILLDTGAGKLRYAHLNPGARYVKAGDFVRGGALIGRSGMTGNATGPHTHFDVNGNYNARGWMQSRGIPLNKGAARINFDNTLANLHRGEAVLTEDLNRKFHEGVNNFAEGARTTYNDIKVYASEGMDEKALADLVAKRIERQERRKPRSRRNG